MKFDIYWNQQIFDMIVKEPVTKNRIRSYISKTNLIRYVNKSYDDTLDEDVNPEIRFFAPAAENEVVYEDDDPRKVTIEAEEEERLIDFWGAGFTKEFYLELDARYKRWTENIPGEMEIAEIALYKQICLKEAEINRNIAAGKSTDTSVNSLNNLLDSLNQKPSQKKKDKAEGDALLDSTSFGVGIRMYENTRPIPKPLPELEDVDGIKRYITVWFIFDRPYVQRCAWSTL